MSNSDQATSTSPQAKPDPEDRGPRYCVNIEETEHPWTEDTITTEQIADLGGWDPELGVLEIDKDNNERRLEPGEVIELTPGRSFCRRFHFKRGFERTKRIDEEIGLLRQHYSNLEYKAPWVRLPAQEIPVGWSPRNTDIAFVIVDGYPGVPPYGIYVPIGLKFEGQAPTSYVEPAQVQPPFDGTWGVFSWTVEQSEWIVTKDVGQGANFLHWVRSFTKRFKEGA